MIVKRKVKVEHHTISRLADDVFNGDWLWKKKKKKKNNKKKNDIENEEEEEEEK